MQQERSGTCLRARGAKRHEPQKTPNPRPPQRNCEGETQVRLFGAGSGEFKRSGATEALARAFRWSAFPLNPETGYGSSTRLPRMATGASTLLRRNRTISKAPNVCWPRRGCSSRRRQRNCSRRRVASERPFACSLAPMAIRSYRRSDYNSPWRNCMACRWTLQRVGRCRGSILHGCRQRERVRRYGRSALAFAKSHPRALISGTATTASPSVRATSCIYPFGARPSRRAR